MTPDIKRKTLLAIIILMIGMAIVWLESGKVSPGAGTPGGENVVVLENIEKEKTYDRAVEIAGATGYLNTNNQPITIGELIGKKVILVDFWTYSCINCQRTLPYLTEWYAKYRDQGLEIVSIHTPEFEFEKDPENVRRAAEKFVVKYPIVQDNNYGTWRAYGNRYWPRKYLIDIDGYIVYDHIGEGGYEETEAKIHELLKERAGRLGESISIGQGMTDPEDKYQIGDVGSPETYFGSLRNERLGNGLRGASYEKNFSAPDSPAHNVLYLDGPWAITDEFAESRGPAKIIYRYQSKNVYLVVSAPNGVSGTIMLDGNPVGVHAGKDVIDGVVHFKADALYHLVEHDSASEEHVLEIHVHDEGLRAFAFTFG